MKSNRRETRCYEGDWRSPLMAPERSTSCVTTDAKGVGSRAQQGKCSLEEGGRKLVRLIVTFKHPTESVWGKFSWRLLKKKLCRNPSAEHAGYHSKAVGKQELL